MHAPPVDASAPRRSRAGGAIPVLVGLLLACVLARVPALLNARGVHSDAAIVGLQARHILDGEWSWFLWGTGYQASFDAAVVAAAFAVTGPSALTLMAVPLVGHLVLVGLAYDVVRRAVGVGGAAIACLPLVLAPPAVNGVALYAPRQWSITAVVLAVWLITGSVGRPRAPYRLAGGAFLTGFALYLDLFTLQLLPGVAVITARCVPAPPREGVRRRIGGLLAGGLLGAAVLAVSRAQPVADGGKAGLTLDRLAANWDLLVGTCLPSLLGIDAYVPDGPLGTQVWDAPWPMRVVQVLGGLAFLGAFAWAVVALARRTGSPAARGLGALGAVVTASSIGGFLVSSMPVDLLSARYLAPVVWFAPFLFAPAAEALGARRFGIGLAPYLVAGAVGGWLAFGPYVEGIVPVRDPRGLARDEAALGVELRSRGISYAAAQYWLSYRLTFLFDEAPVVVPFDDPDDRYAPYREAWRAAPVVAYVFHPSEPRAQAAPVEAELLAAGARYERIEVRGFTVLVVRRGP